MGRKIAVKEWGADDLPRIGILLSTHMQDYGGGSSRYAIIKASPVAIVDGSPRNLDDRQPLCDVEMRGQMDETSGRYYGLTPEVHANSYTYINLQRAKVMVQTLTTISKRLAALNDRYGVANDAATAILRFADAIGADTFIVRVGEQQGSLYADSTWNEFDAPVAQSWINTREREALAWFKGETA